MRIVIFTVFALFAAPAAAQTSCTCTCFDGRPQAICTDATEVPVCTPDVCPRKPPALAPLPAPSQSHITCKPDLVWNEQAKQWEYRQVCSKN